MTRYPNLGQILWVSLLALLLALCAVFLFGHIVSPGSLQARLILGELALVWFLALFIRRRRLVPEDLLLFNATPLLSLAITIPIAISASLLIDEFNLFLGQLLDDQRLGMSLSAQRELLEIQLVRSLTGLGPGLLAVVVVPGLCEEIFFRGFVFTGLYAHHGSRMAVPGSALMFSMAHLLYPWQLLPALFLFGLFLGALVYWTHSVYPAALAHVINNLVSFAQLNLRTYLGLEAFDPHQHLPLPLAALFLMILVGGLLRLRRQPTIMPLPVRQGPPSRTLPGLPYPN